LEGLKPEVLPDFGVVMWINVGEGTELKSIIETGAIGWLYRYYQ
jgi:hypothetical protein